MGEIAVVRSGRWLPSADAPIVPARDDGLLHKLETLQPPKRTFREWLKGLFGRRVMGMRGDQVELTRVIHSSRQFRAAVRALASGAPAPQALPDALGPLLKGLDPARSSREALFANARKLAREQPALVAQLLGSHQGVPQKVRAELQSALAKIVGRDKAAPIAQEIHAAFVAELARANEQERFDYFKGQIQEIARSDASVSRRHEQLEHLARQVHSDKRLSADNFVRIRDAVAGLDARLEWTRQAVDEGIDALVRDLHVDDDGARKQLEDRLAKLRQFKTGFEQRSGPASTSADMSAFSVQIQRAIDRVEVLSSYAAEVRELGASERLEDLVEKLQNDARLSAPDKQALWAALERLDDSIKRTVQSVDRRIEQLTRDIHFDTPPEKFQAQLARLRLFEQSIKQRAPLAARAGESPVLLARVEQAIDRVEIMRQRREDLASYGRQYPQLARALESLKMERVGQGPARRNAYVETMQGLRHVLGLFKAEHHAPILQAINNNLGQERSITLLADFYGDNAGSVTDLDRYIDMAFPGPEWNDDAYRIKLDRLDRQTQTKRAEVEVQYASHAALVTDSAYRAQLASVQAQHQKALLNLQVQHNQRIVNHELDRLMREAGLHNEKLPISLFGAVKADAQVIKWLVTQAPEFVADKSLLIANWIRLSLHDPAAGGVRRESLDPLLRGLGLPAEELDRIEQYIAQGFRSLGDVVACRAQIQAFTRAFQASLTGQERVQRDVLYRAEVLADDLLETLDIHGDDAAQIDARMRQRLNQLSAWARGGPGASRPTSGQEESLDAFLKIARRIATLQVAAASQDPDFTTSGVSRDGVPYKELILQRMDAFGLDQAAKDPGMRRIRERVKARLDMRLSESLVVRMGQRIGQREAVSNARSLEQLCDRIAGDLGKDYVLFRTAERVKRDHARAIARSFDELTPGKEFAISFGVFGEASVSVPVFPGLGAGSRTRVARYNSITIERPEGGAYGVRIQGGSSVQQRFSLATVGELLSFHVDGGSASEHGHRFTFQDAQACRAFVMELAQCGQAVDPRLWSESSVQRVAQDESNAGVALSADADFVLAAVSAEVAASRGSAVETIEEAGRRTEIHTRQMKVGATLSAELVAGALDASKAVGVDLRARKVMDTEYGMFTANAMLVLGAKVMNDNTKACLKALLPHLDDKQRKLCEERLGKVPEGAELFVRCRLRSDIVQGANRELGLALQARTRARLAPDARARASELAAANRHAKAAYALTAQPNHYVVEGIGLTTHEEGAVSHSRGVYTKYAASDSRDTRFLPFEADVDAHAPVKPPLTRSLASRALAALIP